jgi:exodeoxyribonuclease VII small subunit
LKDGGLLMAKRSEKPGKKEAGIKNPPRMKNFEERLEKLEELGELIRQTDVPLDEALRAFEEGIRIARTLEKDLEKVESRIELLLNETEAPDTESPELELFDGED